MFATLKRLVPVVALFTLAACDGSSDDNDNLQAQVAAPATGLIEVIHASQDAPAVNVLAGGAEVISDLDYREAEFLTVDDR